MSSASPKAWVVAFCSQKGGVGKSTLARGLATFAAREGGNVKMVDFDPQQQSVKNWNAARQSDGEGLTVSEAGNSEELGPLLEGAGMIIIDAPGRASKATLEIAKLSHLIVQPTGGSRDDIVPGERVFAELIEAGIPKDRLAFALSRTDSETEEKGTRIYLESQGYYVLPGSLQNRSGYKVAQNNGRSVLETNFESLNAKAEELISGIAKRLFAIHGVVSHVSKGAETESRRLRASKKDAA